MKNRGLFITFEGTEGAGKSTLIKAISAQLKKRKISFVLTREPGGHPLSEKIRDLILKSEMDPWTELFLYEASRAEHVAKTIRPALEAGKLVLCDRYGDSSLAYQAYARGLSWKEVKMLNRTATRGLNPDVSVFIDVDPKHGLDKATDPNRFEAEGVKFQEKVRKGFLKIIKEEPRRWIRIEGFSATPEEMAQTVLNKIGRIK